MPLAALPATADSLRLAVYHTELSRRGPGLLLRDILRGDDAQIAATVEMIAELDADIVLLLGLDYDADGVGLAALEAALAEAGASYPHALAFRPNTGRQAGLDLDGDGRMGEPEDAFGYGWFSGEGGMALLSRLHIDHEAARDFTDFLWRDLPDGHAAEVLDDAALAVLPLASVGLWDVPVILPGGDRFHVLALHASAPVFDGPEDRNGLRNADQLGFLTRYLDGWAPWGAPFAGDQVAVMGTLNVDPARGEGRQEALRTLIDHPALQDPEPSGPDGRIVTVDWAEPSPGDLRVDYVLPAAALDVVAAGVAWGGSTAEAASAHRPVWVEIALPTTRAEE